MLADDTFNTWKIPNKLFGPIDGTFFFYRNLKLASMRVVETFPIFSQGLVQLYVITSQVEPKNIGNILNDSLLNNSFAFHQAFSNKNILKVGDLLTESGTFKPGKWLNKSVT